jgi:hypothetical protein
MYSEKKRGDSSVLTEMKVSFKVTIIQLGEFNSIYLAWSSFN